MELVEQAGDGAGADPDTQALELAGDLGRGLVGPSPAARRIARGIVFQQPFDLSDYLGRFFSTRLRPPPLLRARSSSTSWANNCSRPRATVWGWRSRKSPH